MYSSKLGLIFGLHTSICTKSQNTDHVNSIWTEITCSYIFSTYGKMIATNATIHFPAQNPNEIPSHAPKKNNRLVVIYKNHYTMQCIFVISEATKKYTRTNRHPPPLDPSYSPNLIYRGKMMRKLNSKIKIIFLLREDRTENTRPVLQCGRP